MLLAIIAMLVTGCEKGSETAKNTNQASKAEAVKPTVHIDQLTEKEREDLEALKESPSAETATQAEEYLKHLDATPAQEIRDFITNAWEEWEALNRQDAENEYQDTTNQSDATMQYRIEVFQQFYAANKSVDTAYLNLISLSDSIMLDRVVVNRGNCRADYRDGKNPIGYGQTVRFMLNCDPRNVREVVAILKDGREIVMTAQ